jgi:hypothetical protein
MLHLDLPTPADIGRLAAERADICLSIYLPTTPLTQDIGVARLALRSLWKRSEEELHAAGADKRRVALLADHIADLHDDEDFWAHQATGLAIFATPDSLSTFRLPTRLREAAEISDRFRIKPLFRPLAFPDTGFVLALAHNGARLVELPGEGPAREVKVPGLPKSVDDAGARTRTRNTAPGGRFQGGRGDDFHRRSFARQVDAALRPLLSGKHGPLILAGVAEFEAIYRSVNSYPHLTAGAVRGNAEHMTAAELAEAARPVLREQHAAEIGRLAALFRERTGAGRTLTDLADIGRAAAAGGIDTLLVDIDSEVPGHYDEATGAVRFADAPGPDSHDVADDIVRTVIGHGGRVIGLRREDMPDGAPVAAILRFGRG